MFKRREREVPGLNTAALPDLIFTVLFFFMIVTHMRQTDVKVQYTVPQGTELNQLANKATAQYVYIGLKSQEALSQGTDKEHAYYIQLNDKLVTLDELRSTLAKQRQMLSDEDQERMVVSIRADRHAPLGIIADVKRALREAGALKVNYSAMDISEKKE